MKNSLLFVFMFTMLFANAQQQTFSKVYYNGVDNIQAYDLMRSADNHYFIAGTGFITKTDSAGNIDWTKNYYTGMQNKFNCIIPDPDGNPVVAGYSNDGDALIMKIDQNGDTLWARYLDFGSFSEAFTVSQVHDSGFVLCGYIYASSLPNEMFVARIDQDGNLIWSKTYTIGNHSNYAYSVKETADSGFIVTGLAENYPPIEMFSIIIKLRSNGDVEWCKNLSVSSANLDLISDVIVSGDDFIFSGAIGGDYVLIKTDSAGQVKWAKNQMVYSDGYINSPQTRIRKISNNRIMMLTSSEMGWFGTLMVCDSLGNQISQNSIYLYGSSAVEAADNGFMVLGNGPMLGVKSDPKNITESQFVLVKTDSSGNSIMCNDPLTAASSAISVTSSLMTPTVTPAGAINHLGCVINNIIVTVANECVGFLGGFEDSQIGSFSVYPNPSNGAFSLQFDNPNEKTGCTISVYNALGDCVYNVSRNLQNENFIDLSEMNSGLYYVVVTSEGRTMSRIVEICK